VTEHRLHTSLELPLPPATVFAFFADAANLEVITPPELQFLITTPLPVAMKKGALIDYKLRLHGIPFSWRTRISEWEPPFRFVDEQLRGPYALWEHTHTFTEAPGGGTLVQDTVRYRMPLGFLGRLALPLVRRDLSRIFGYREVRVRQLLGSLPTDDCGLTRL